MQTSTTIAAKPCRGDPSGVSAASTPLPIRHNNTYPSLDYLKTPFHCPLLNPPSNSPAVWLGFCFAEGGVKSCDRWFVRAAPHTLRSTFPLSNTTLLMQTSTTIAAKPCRGDPSGVSAASTPLPIRHNNAYPSLASKKSFHYPLPNPPSNSPVATDRAVALRKGALKAPIGGSCEPHCARFVLFRSGIKNRTC